MLSFQREKNGDDKLYRILWLITYCGWKISCTTLDGWHPINNGMFTIYQLVQDFATIHRTSIIFHWVIYQGVNPMILWSTGTWKHFLCSLPGRPTFLSWSRWATWGLKWRRRAGFVWTTLSYTCMCIMYIYILYIIHIYKNNTCIYIYIHGLV